MRLSELVSNLTPTQYTQVALVIFLVVFVGIVIYVFSRRNRETFERARSLPLEDDVYASEQPATGSKQ
jgi:cbb3-type cytochrome oxidase subunit 3